MPLRGRASTGRCCMPRRCSGLLVDAQAPGSTSWSRRFINSWLRSAAGIESTGVARTALLIPSLLGSNAQVVKFLRIQWTHCRHECVISPIVRTIQNSQVQWAGWARNHGFSFKDVFSMKHHNPEGFGPPSPDLVSPQSRHPGTRCSAAVAWSGLFTHVHQSLK